MQKPKNTREWLIHITDQINMFRNWKEQEELVNHLLANDVVSVVRCKNCKYYYCADRRTHLCTHKNNLTLKTALTISREHFCSYGERKD